MREEESVLIMLALVGRGCIKM